MNNLEIMEQLFTDSNLSSFIEKIQILPDRVRDENSGNYQYPEQFENKIVYLGNKFLIFNNNRTTYEEISFSHVAFLIMLFSQLGFFTNNSTSNIDISKFVSLENFNTIIENISAKFKEVESSITNSFKELENKINALESTPSNINSSEWEELKSKLEKSLSEYDSINDDFKNQLLALNKQIENIQNTPPAINIEDVIKNIQSTLPSIIENKKDVVLSTEFNQFKEYIDNQIHSIHQQLVITSNKSNIINTEWKELHNIDDNIAKYIDLKNAGFTADEIITLKNNNMI